VQGRWFLKLSAVLAWLFGLMLIFNTRQFESPVGIDVTDKVATIAQAQGAILLGLGVINWMTAGGPGNATVLAVLAGNLVVQVASLAVAARALALGIFSPSAAPAVVIHVLLGAGFLYYLARMIRALRGQTAAVTR
jgi:hypothetical protein